MKLSQILFETYETTKSMEDIIVEMLEEIESEIGEQFEIRSIKYGGDQDYHIILYVPSIEQTLTDRLDYPVKPKFLAADKKRLKEKLLKMINVSKRNEEKFLAVEYWERFLIRVKDLLGDSVASEVEAEMSANSDTMFGFYLNLRDNWEGAVTIDMKYNKRTGEIDLDIWYDEEGYWHKRADLMEDFQGSLDSLAKWIVREAEAFIDMNGLNR
jgi:hypothetical protein